MGHFKPLVLIFNRLCQMGPLCPQCHLSLQIVMFSTLTSTQVFVSSNFLPVMPIDTVSNLVFWSRFANKLEPWHNVYIF